MSSTAPTPTLEIPRERREFEYDFVPQRHTRTARGLRTRKLVLRGLVWSAALGGIAFFGAFLFYAGMFDFADPAPPQVAAPDTVSDTLTMGHLQFNGFDKKNQAYSLGAEQAQQDRERPNIIHLTQVRAELKLHGSGDVVFVRADTGTYDTQAETLSIASNIKVQTTNGYTARLETAEVTLKEGLVVSNDPVVVTTTAGTVRSNGMRMWDNATHIQFTNRVRVDYGGSGGRGDAG